MLEYLRYNIALSKLLSNALYVNWTTWLAVLIVVSIIFLIRRSRKSGFNLPPGPKGYPILGHIPYLMKNPHVKLKDYQGMYGPIFSIKFGRKDVVVLGDFYDIKATYKMQGLTMRASELFTMSSRFTTVTEVNGKEWFDRRRFALSVIRAANREKSTEQIIEEEVTRLLENIEKRYLSKDVNLRNLLSIVSNNVGFSLICGKSFDEDDPAMKLLLKYNKDALGYFQWLIFGESLMIPKFFYKHFFPLIKIGMKTIIELDDFIRKEIAEHKRTLDPENPRDFIDFGLMEMNKPEDCHKVHDYSSIRGDCHELLLAGTDTVRGTMEWCILLLAKYPSIQGKIFKEIVDVLGDQRPTWADHQRLPYFQAFILEAQRHQVLVPLNLIRRVPRDIKIKEYDVPEGTWLFVNLWSVHSDPNLWKEPEKFDPTRFLNEERDKAIEPEFWIPFSIGNRNCLGEKVARTELFITLSSLIQHYRVLPSTKGVSLEGILNITYEPVYPEARFEKRAPNQLKNSRGMCCGECSFPPYEDFAEWHRQNYP